ncbi:MAG TPA: ATP-binding cassette domain-containing protein [Bacteroidia bacterium]|nr:ATP-binding cassette domain-containing protein [Bacteroidia bacterium]
MNSVKPHTAKSESAVIEITHLKKSFKDNAVLKDVTFTVGKGENLVVLGKSGTGKSVLIKCIVGLIKPDSGNLKIFGKSLVELNRNELDKVREKIGFLFQSNALYDSMTVRKNLEFPLRRDVKKEGQPEIDRRVKEALANVGLTNTIDMMPSELSGGMRKRIGLARCLMVNPEVMLYDEPTTGLDPITAEEISKLMVAMKKKYKSSSIIITHDMKCAKLTADQMLVLVDGLIYAKGTYQELEKSKDKKIKPFFE